MRLGIVQMGKSFGELAHIRGIVYHRLSPFELKAFAGTFKKGVPNTIRRMAENVWRTVPVTIVAYLFYMAVEKEADRLKRKDPAKYACDQ